MPRDPDTPRLMFSPRAWLKWQYLCHCGPTEVGAFGLSREANLLYMDDLIVLKQLTTVVSVAFDDGAVADLFDEMADAGIPSGRFARVWLHTQDATGRRQQRQARQIIFPCRCGIRSLAFRR